MTNNIIREDNYLSNYGLEALISLAYDNTSMPGEESQFDLSKVIFKFEQS